VLLFLFSFCESGYRIDCSHLFILISRRLIHMYIYLLLAYYLSVSFSKNKLHAPCEQLKWSFNWTCQRSLGLLSTILSSVSSSPHCYLPSVGWRCLLQSTLLLDARSLLSTMKFACIFMALKNLMCMLHWHGGINT